jgi:hypothetical protein
MLAQLVLLAAGMSRAGSATAALAVPESLGKTMSEYSHDPQVRYAYRDGLGHLIDRSGLADANPWGDDFGVRGFAAER